MKKLLAIVVVSMVSLSCMAGHHSRRISIKNNTNNTIDVRDRDNNEVSVEPGRSTSLNIRVEEPHGSLFPSSLMPHVTTLTVTDDEGENTIKVDEHTKSVIVDEGLELSENSESSERSED